MRDKKMDKWTEINKNGTEMDTKLGYHVYQRVSRETLWSVAIFQLPYELTAQSLRPRGRVMCVTVPISVSVWLYSLCPYFCGDLILLYRISVLLEL